MKPFIYSLLLVFFVALAGCQKEPSLELGESSAPGETPDGNRLVRLVYQVSVTDSSYTDFFYDAAGRYTGQRTEGGDALLSEFTEINVVRAANGIITGYSVKQEDGSGGEVSTNYTVYYDAAAQRYTAKVSEFDINGEIIIDSTAFEISNGQMTSQHFIYKERASGQSAEVGKTEFTYNGSGNATTIITSSIDPSSGGGASTPVNEVALQYDSKNSPLNLGVEGLVLDQIFFATPNNITNLSFKDLTEPQPTTENLGISYKYHASSKPKSAVLSVQGMSFNLYYRYGN